MTALARHLRPPGRARRVARSDVLLLAFALLAVASVAWATMTPRAANLDTRAAQIEAGLRCPVCQGLSIADSPSQTAQEMRSVVRQQLAAGADDDAVRAYFVARYGPWILLTPAPSGLGLGLWLAPGLLLVAGSALLAGPRRRMGVRGGSMAPLPARATALVRLGIVGLAVVAVAVPLWVAVGPRQAGQQITGQPAVAARPAIADLEAAARTSPGDAAAQSDLGQAYLAAGRESDAAAAFELALAADPRDVHALVGLGVILLGANRPSAAGPLLDRALAVVPDEPDALFYRGLARYETDGAVTQAVRADLVRFLAVAPGDPRRAMVEQLLQRVPAGSSPSAGASPPVVPSPTAGPSSPADPAPTP